MASAPLWPPYEELDHSNRQNAFIIVIVFFTALATVFVLGRLYTRAFVVRSFGNDDWSIFFAAVTLWASSLTSVIQIQRGHTGYHIWDITFDPVRWMSTQKIVLANQLLYNPVLALTKASLLLFYLRISINTTFHLYVWATMWFTIGLGISIFVAVLFQCTPIAFFWDSSIVDGKCFNQIAFYFIQAGINTATDLWILLLPMPIFLGLQISVKRRIILISLFALGAVVVVMSIIRLNAIHRMYFRTNDPTYDDVAIWSTMELCLAVVCACIPTLRPLFSRRFPPIFSSIGKSASQFSGEGCVVVGPRRRAPGGQNFDLEELGIADNKGGVYGTGMDKSTSNDSEKMIIGKSASELASTPSPTVGSDLPSPDAHARDTSLGAVR